MRLFKILFLAACVISLSACSISTEDVTDAVSQKIEKEIDRVGQIAKEELGKKVEEKLSDEIQKVNKYLPELKTETDKPSSPIETGGTTERIPVKYVRTVDGDTIRVIYDGQEVSLRYLLMDTPESVHPKLGKQPFGEEASNRNQELLESGKVSIEFDIGERIDRYGRLLAYVYVDDVNVTETLIREGLARVAYVYPPNTRHLDMYEKAQDAAKKEGAGIWSIENYVTNRGFGSE